MRKLSVLVTATFVGCERASRICEGRVVGSNEVVQVDVDRVVKDALRRMDEGLPSSPLYGGIEVDTTIDRRLQRKLTEILCRNADTNDTGVGVGVILRVEDGAVLAMADCGEESDGIPLAVGRSYELGSVMMADRICNTYDFYQCQEIDRARAYLGYADELFARIGEVKYAGRIQETLDACRRIVNKSTISERASGFFKRTGLLVGIIRR